MLANNSGGFDGDRRESVLIILRGDDRWGRGILVRSIDHGTTTPKS